MQLQRIQKWNWVCSISHKKENGASFPLHAQKKGIKNTIKMDLALLLLLLRTSSTYTYQLIISKN